MERRDAQPNGSGTRPGASDAGDRLIEVTDLLVDLDEDGSRLPVSVDRVMAACQAAGDRWGARTVRALPSTGGYIQPDDIDRYVVAAHLEIQRLSQEFRQPARMWSVLEPVTAAVRASTGSEQVHLVDIGCGTGYLVRWLAANRHDPALRLTGADLNPALVREAERLALAEDLSCAFVHGDALSLDAPCQILVSTGFLHHLRGDALHRFFAAQEGSATPLAFIHVDLQPSWLAPFGAWLFHQTRMRLRLSRHDGVRSAQRAYDPEVLADAVRRSAPSYATWHSQPRVAGTPFPQVLTTFVGARAPLVEHLDEALTRRAPRLRRST